MARLLAGIGELHVSRSPEDTIVALGLGSCVAVILFDPGPRVAGMAHCMLAKRRTTQQEDWQRPAICVESGVPHLVRAMVEAGASASALLGVLIGGAAMFSFGGPSIFDIGSENAAAARRLLASYGVRIVATELGGNQGRTATLRVADGAVSVRSEVTERTLVTLSRLGAGQGLPLCVSGAEALLRRAA